MRKHKINLVKYAGEYWVTLVDYTSSRSTEGYSNAASVKSAIRSYTLRLDANGYIAFRGEDSVKNIIKENENNPLFYKEDFQGHTRTALIHFNLLEELNKRFDSNSTEGISEFINEANEYIKETKSNVVPISESTDTNKSSESRSTVIYYLRTEMNNIDKEIEAKVKDKERIMRAINEIESLS